MTRSTPTIRDTTLLFAEDKQELAIVVGSERWFEWLRQETTTIFSFHSIHGSYTARKEGAGNHRGGWYWKAYRKYQGVLYRAYIGKSDDLTEARLNEVALTLSSRMHEQVKSISGIAELNGEAQNQRLWDATIMPLLETKLYPPRLPSLLVERSRLLAQLDAGQTQKVILVHAPAGFGKTTLITQWLAHRQSQAINTQQNLAPVAWISLDSGDNDPIRFWSTIIAACQSLGAHVGQTALAQLSTTSSFAFAQTPLETTLTLLLNDLARSNQQGIVILEDYHCIEQPRLHETLAFFIEHLPANLRVIILTRSEPSLPLLRWRARGDILELRSNHLRFSADETAVFLQQILPQTPSQEAILLMHDHLEGWAVGLRLLALSLQSQMTPQTVENVLAQLRGDALASPSPRPIQEYFLSEVLSAQPEPLQLFLLQTSLLSRLSGSLCNAVTGRHDSAEWLVLIERSGFFLEALDSTGQWYRYHALFAEAMRAEAVRRLGEEALRHLSLQASYWYEVHGMLAEAIESVLFAREFAKAAYLIESLLDEEASFPEHHTMRRWLSELPVPQLHDHPLLCLGFAQALLLSEESGSTQESRERAEDLLKLAEETWRGQGNMAQVGTLFAFRATYELLQGQLDPAVVYAQQAFQFLPLTAGRASDHTHSQAVKRIDWRCGCLNALALQAMQDGFFDKAHQYLLEAYTISLDSEDRIFTRIIGRMLGDVSIELGELHQAASYYQQTLADVFVQDNDGGEDIIYTFATARLAWLSYEWNELEKAEQLARQVIEYPYRGYLRRWEEEARTQGELLRLLVLHARGEASDARAVLSALFVRLQTSAHTLQLLPDVLIWQTRLQIRDGDLVGASRTLESLSYYTDELSPLQHESMRMLSARLLLARGEAEVALSLLTQLLPRAEERKHLLRVAEIQLLIALAYAACKQEQEAQRYLCMVLSQTRTEGFVRLFLDEGEPLATLLRQLLPSITEKSLYAYAQRIVRAFAVSLPDHARGGNGEERLVLEPLSSQERRVLALLAAGHSNPEIADRLVVSLNTVKGHVKSLYRKLNVNNRVQAGEIARRENLL